MDTPAHKIIEFFIGKGNDIEGQAFPFICMADVRTAEDASRLIEKVGNALLSLKALEGKRIGRIGWDSEPTREDNPDGTRGRVVVEIIPD